MRGLNFVIKLSSIFGNIGDMIKVKTIFISDVHLGSRACQADRLLEFLKAYDAEQIFLIGDIIDFWAMKNGIHWTGSQNTVIQKILRQSRHGKEVFYIPGNHDEALRDYCGTDFGTIRLVEEWVYQSINGKKFLIIHGDVFDQVTKYHRWIAVLGDKAYDYLALANLWLSWIRRKLRRPGYWSLAGYAKRKVKTALNFIFDFEKVAIRHVRERGLNGIICGHIHWAAIHETEGFQYINCGDWVDSCSAIVEHLDGSFELVSWGAVCTDVLTQNPLLTTQTASVFEEEIQ